LIPFRLISGKVTENTLLNLKAKTIKRMLFLGHKKVQPTIDWTSIIIEREP